MSIHVYYKPTTSNYPINNWREIGPDRGLNAGPPGFCSTDYPSRPPTAHHHQTNFVDVVWKPHRLHCVALLICIWLEHIHQVAPPLWKMTPWYSPGGVTISITVCSRMAPAHAHCQSHVHGSAHRYKVIASQPRAIALFVHNYLCKRLSWKVQYWLTNSLGYFWPTQEVNTSNAGPNNLFNRLVNIHHNS